MIIAAIVISVLSITVSGYSFTQTRRCVKARKETERLRRNYLEARAKGGHPQVID